MKPGFPCPRRQTSGGCRTRSLDRIGRVLASVLLCAGIAGAQPAQGPPPAKVRVGEARAEELEQRRAVTGELRPVRRSLLASKEEGLVERIAVEEGQAVKAGDAIAQLDDKRMRLEIKVNDAEVVSRRAIIEARRAEVEKARRDLARFTELAAKEAESQSLVDDSSTALATAEARVKEAEAEIRLSEARHELWMKRLADMAVTAPFDGVIVSKRAEPGRWLKSGDPVAEIVSSGEIEAWIHVPESYVDRLGDTSLKVELKIPGLNTAQEARITQIVPDADTLSRLFPVRLRLPNPEGRLRAGMSVVGLVPTGAREKVTTVPKDAILRDDAGEFLYFEAGGAAAVARVESLFAQGDRVAVKSERLQPGVKVVVEGNERLFPGQPLLISE